MITGLKEKKLEIIYDQNGRKLGGKTFKNLLLNFYHAFPWHPTQYTWFYEVLHSSAAFNVRALSLIAAVGTYCVEYLALYFQFETEEYWSPFRHEV